MNYASVCSGAEAFGPAWHELGFKPVFHAETEKHASAVLRLKFPTTPNHDDFTQIATFNGPTPNEPIRLLCGGTPCQSFSPAGLREGINSVKGILALEFVRLAKRLGAKWILWENVPGVLSSDGGEAFGAFLGALAECGYGFAYRVLDAANFGCGQQRERVFVVGCLGNWQAAAAVLFEAGTLGQNDAPRRPKPAYYTHAYNQDRIYCPDGLAPTCVASDSNQRQYFITDTGLRALMPIERERLQGWGDDWTRHGVNEKGELYELSDTQRYRIIGNGWAAPVVTWIAKRILMVDALLRE